VISGRGNFISFHLTEHDSSTTQYGDLTKELRFLLIPGPGVRGAAFTAAAYHGVFEVEAGTNLPHWRNQTRLAKENTPASNVFWRGRATCHAPTGRPATWHAPPGRPATCHLPTGRPATCPRRLPGPSPRARAVARGREPRAEAQQDRRPQGRHARREEVLQLAQGRAVQVGPMKAVLKAVLKAPGTKANPI